MLAREEQAKGTGGGGTGKEESSAQVRDFREVIPGTGPARTPALLQAFKVSLTFFGGAEDNIEIGRAHV